jgi:polyisoprenoid-binding protein YceI
VFLKFKNMKKLKIAVIASIALVSIYAFTPKSTKFIEPNYKANLENSKVEFSGSKKNGYHPGVFNLKSGGLAIEAGKITGGNFVIDMASVKVTDGAGEKLAGHLKAPDFFDVAKFGEATYNITSVNYTSENTATIKGDLTVKGITVNVNLDAFIRSVDETKGTFFAEAFLNLDRTLFGINYGAGNISKDVQVSIHLFASK